jgi:hypothetical protein
METIIQYRNLDLLTKTNPSTIETRLSAWSVDLSLENLELGCTTCTLLRSTAGDSVGLALVVFFKKSCSGWRTKQQNNTTILASPANSVTRPLT